MMGRRFHISGRWASVGKSHQYIWRIDGAAIMRFGTRGGRTSAAGLDGKGMKRR